MENPPNQTLYINNLNEKVKKEGKDHSCSASDSDFCISTRAKEITLCHFLTIRTHSGHCCNEDTQNEGTGLCSVSSKHLKTVHVIGSELVAFLLQDISSATNALRSMQGFPFYDKPMVRH